MAVLSINDSLMKTILRLLSRRMQYNFKSSYNHGWRHVRHAHSSFTSNDASIFSFSIKDWLPRANSKGPVHYGEIYIEIRTIYLSGKQMISGQPLAVQLFAKKQPRMRIVRQTKIDGRRYSGCVYATESAITNNGGVRDGETVCRRRKSYRPVHDWCFKWYGRRDGSHGISTPTLRLAFSYQTETVLRKQNQVLTPGLIQGAMTRTECIQ